MNEEEKEKQELREFKVDRYSKAEDSGKPEGSGGSFLRGCLIAIGIAFLVFMFAVGACFMSF